MTTLSGALYLNRAVLVEVTEDPNVVPRTVVAGTSGAIGGGSQKMDETALDGAFRSYGNGNTRLILGSGSTRIQTVALRALAPSQVAVVRDLLGHTVCYRDTYGRRIFGAFIDMQVSDIPLSGKPQDDTLMTDVALQIQTVTYDESV